MRSNLPKLKRENRNDWYWARDLLVSGITVGKGSGAISTNTVVGNNSLASNSAGFRNTAFGASSLQTNLNGYENTSIGYRALWTNTTGYNNTAIGSQAYSSSSTGYNNTVVGFQAVVGSTSHHSTSIGATSGYTGNYNTAVGANALNLNSGNNSTCVGYNSLYWCGGSNNIALGMDILSTAGNTASNNIGIGNSALFNTSKSAYNVACGHSSLYALRGDRILAGSFIIGNSYTIAGTGSTSFTAIGSANNSLGTEFIATGVGSGTGECTPNNNTVAIGNRAGYLNYLGSNLTVVGGLSGYSNSKLTSAGGFTIGAEYIIVTVGSTDYTLIGASTSTIGVRFTATGVGTGTGSAAGVANNNTAVGYKALYANEIYQNVTGVGANTAVTGSNQVQLGDSVTTTYAYGAIQDRSDIRDKAEVRDTILGLAFIESLRPVDFKWDKREDYRTTAPTKPDYPERVNSEKLEDEAGEDYRTRTDVEYKIVTDAIDAEFAIVHDAWLDANKLANITHDGTHTRNRYHHGVIAQEVPAEFGGLQNHALKGGDDVLSVGYEEFIAPIIKAIQELSAENKMLKAYLGL